MKNSLLKISCASLFALALQVQAKVVDEVERSFDVDADSSLRLENINGGVNILAWDKNIIRVNAVITADDQDDRERIHIDMDQNSRGVHVETRYEKESGWGNNHSSGKVEYTVMVPVNAELAGIDLVNGSLSIDGVKGEIRAELVNGSIEALGLADDSDLSSVNGSIRVSYQDKVNALDSVELETVNGSIKLYLPEDINASVDVDTMHGSIKNDFGLSADKNMFVGRSLRGDIGSGDVKITMESVNGSVKILKN